MMHNLLPAGLPACPVTCQSITVSQSVCTLFVQLLLLQPWASLFPLMFTSIVWFCMGFCLPACLGNITKGWAQVREELSFAITQPIAHPEQYAAMGLGAATGVLLYGPPGCGKTLVAKAIANESGVNFISIKVCPPASSCSPCCKCFTNRYKWHLLILTCSMKAACYGGHFCDFLPNTGHTSIKNFALQAASMLYCD